LSFAQEIDQVATMHQKGLVIVDRAKTCLDPPPHRLRMDPEQVGDLPDGIAETFE
jgi:hypothetical protein